MAPDLLVTKGMRPLKRTAGFGIMESVIALSLLAIVASSTVYAMVSSNRYVVTQRYVSNAKALCQERIDQALTHPFPPTTTTTFFGNWGGLTPGATSTFVENNIPIYTMAAAGSTALVQGTRETSITRFPNPASSDPLFVYARVKVKVEFEVNGRGLNNKLISQGGTKFFYEMTTLRSPD